MLRDRIIHDVIPAYKRGELKLLSETVVHKANLTHTADLLLQVSKEEQPAAVSSEADAINRVTAFFMALEYLGVMTYSKFTKVNGKITGGELSYLGELEKRRQSTPRPSVLGSGRRDFPREGPRSNG